MNFIYEKKICEIYVLLIYNMNNMKIYIVKMIVN